MTDDPLPQRVSTISTARPLTAHTRVGWMGAHNFSDSAIPSCRVPNVTTTLSTYRVRYCGG
eukprot:846006-Pleurochrysis_carterae.AAC.1